MTEPNEPASLLAARQKAYELAELVRVDACRFVLAESCTGGLVAALLAEIPGISEFFCGSAVTYREDTKQKWLGVSRETLAQHSAESPTTTDEMALGALRHTPEANVSAAVTGHLGPHAPDEIDGWVFVSVARRTGNQPQIVRQARMKLTASKRVNRQTEAATFVLNYLCKVVQQATSEQG